MKKPDRHLKESGWVDPKDLPKGPNGRSLCRYCGTETEPPRKSFCSDACVQEWKIRSNGSYAREQVFNRDHGVCSSCGLNTEHLKQLLYKVKNEKGDVTYEQLLVEFRRKTGYSFELGRHAWEADHVVSVADGGGSCGLDNLITLCVPCHRRKTKEWHRNKWKRRAKFTRKFLKR